MTEEGREEPMIVRGADGRYVMTGTDIAASWIVGRLAMGWTQEQLQREHPELTADQIELAQILGLAHAIGEGRRSPDAERDLGEIDERMYVLLAEHDAWRAIEKEVSQAPEHYRLEVLRSIAGTARRERRLFEKIESWDEEEGPPPDREAAERLRTRFDWQIKREDLDRAGADAHTDAAQADPEDSGESSSDE
jgi:uncharacterized protein (DUF433 family)